MERGLIFRTLLKEIFTVLTFYLLMRIWWGDEPWFKDKVKELSFFASMGVFYFIFSLGLALISRPVKIEVTQTNRHFDVSETRFSISGKRRTQEHERTVDLNVIVTRQNSLWGKLALKMLEGKDISIMIEPLTPGLILGANKEPLRNDLSATSTGFEIKIDSYISNILERANRGAFNKGCEYVVSEDRDNVVSNETFHITPRLLSRGQDAPYWLTVLVRFTETSHSVTFKWE